MNKFQLNNAAQLQVYADLAQLSQVVAIRIQTLAAQAIAARGVCHLVLTGGETPRLCYERLRTLPLDWRKIQIYWGDERCLPLGNMQRNERMAHTALLDYVDIPSKNIHMIPAELGPDIAAQQYQATLADVDFFDITLLGMGEDGHTASLFPGNPALADNADVVPVFNAPKAPSERVSLSAARINRSHHKIFLVAGVGKQSALSQLATGISLPVAAIKHAEWYLDQAAFPH